MPIIGTAGHIDHGKTALVRALTGQDTDRLPEERARGISIDLGFARFDGPDGSAFGVVDVPGHERFVRNMLAGAHGMDVVLFVVAADDGVMPQTEEHLDIVHLLGVRRGVFAITKADLVDAARLAAVREEIEILRLDSTLADAPILPVSSLTGAGVPALRRALWTQLAAGVPAPTGPFRLPIDRVFVVHGHGVVVTGTAIAGAVAVGDELRVLPGGTLARVRSIEVHGASVGRAGGGQRIALNLGGVERQALRRGHVVGAARLERTTLRFDAWVEVRPHAQAPIRHHGRVRLHVGTAEVLAKTVLLRSVKALAAGEVAPMQLVVDEPVAVLHGDRFVLRDETARWTIAGGVVVQPFAAPHRSRAAAAELLTTLWTAEPSGAAAALVRSAPGFAVDRATLAEALSREAEAIPPLLAEAPDLIPIPDAAAPEAWTTDARWTALEAHVLETLAAWHREQPLAPGLDVEPLRGGLPWPLDLRAFRWAIDRLAAAGRIARDDGVVRLPSHRVDLAPAAHDLGTRLLALLAAGGLTPPDLRQLTDDLGASAAAVRDVLRVLEREGRVVRVAPDLHYDPGAAAEAVTRLRAHCAAHGEVTAATFRDLIGASRKYAIALLDWTDRTGVTVRVGDVRRLRR